MYLLGLAVLPFSYAYKYNDIKLNDFRTIYEFCRSKRLPILLRPWVQAQTLLVRLFFFVHKKYDVWSISYEVTGTIVFPSGVKDFPATRLTRSSLCSEYTRKSSKWLLRPMRIDIANANYEKFNGDVIVVASLP